MRRTLGSDPDLNFSPAQKIASTMTSQNDAIVVDSDDTHDVAALRADYEAFLPKYGALWKSIAPKLPENNEKPREPLSLLLAIENQQSISLRVPRCNECPWDSSCQGCAEHIVEEINESTCTSQSSSSSSDESVDTAPVRFDLSQLRLEDDQEEEKSGVSNSSPVTNQEEETEFILTPEAQPFRDTANDFSVASSPENARDSNRSNDKDQEDDESGSSSVSSNETTQAGWDLSLLRLEDDKDDEKNEGHEASKSIMSSEDSFTQETQQWLETRAKEKEELSQAIDLLSDSDSDTYNTMKAPKKDARVIKTKSNLRESRKPSTTVRPARVVFADSSSEEEEWDEKKVAVKEELKSTVPPVQCLSPTVIVLSDTEDDLGGDSWRDDEDDDLLDDNEEMYTREAAPASSTKKGKQATTKTPSKTFFRKNREEIGDTAFAEFDRRAFDSALVDVELVWSNKLRTTAGLTRLKQISGGGGPTKRIATIELSTKIIDDELRLRATLLHEMCHAAAWLVDGVSKPPHGSCFKKWANIAMSAVSIVYWRSFPLLPRIYSTQTCSHTFNFGST